MAAWNQDETPKKSLLHRFGGYFFFLMAPSVIWANEVSNGWDGIFVAALVTALMLVIPMVFASALKGWAGVKTNRQLTRDASTTKKLNLSELAHVIPQSISEKSRTELIAFLNVFETVCKEFKQDQAVVSFKAEDNENLWSLEVDSEVIVDIENTSKLIGPLLKEKDAAQLREFLNDAGCASEEDYIASFDCMPGEVRNRIDGITSWGEIFVYVLLRLEHGEDDEPSASIDALFSIDLSTHTQLNYLDNTESWIAESHEC